LLAAGLQLHQSGRSFAQGSKQRVSAGRQGQGPGKCDQPAVFMRFSGGGSISSRPWTDTVPQASQLEPYRLAWINDPDAMEIRPVRVRQVLSPVRLIGSNSNVFSASSFTAPCLRRDIQAPDLAAARQQPRVIIKFRDMVTDARLERVEFLSQGGFGFPQKPRSTHH